MDDPDFERVGSAEFRAKFTRHALHFARKVAELQLRIEAKHQQRDDHRNRIVELERALIGPVAGVSERAGASQQEQGGVEGRQGIVGFAELSDRVAALQAQMEQLVTANRLLTEENEETKVRLMRLEDAATASGTMFITALSTSGVSIRDSGSTVRAVLPELQHAIVNQPMACGRWVWEMVCEEDDLNDEGSYVGVAPHHSICSKISEETPFLDMRLLKCYDGETYVNDDTQHVGRVGMRPLKAVHPGSVVRFELDADARQLSICVNGEDFGVCFRDLPREPLYPVVAFYGQSVTKQWRYRRIYS